jgi:hypothetical protein
MTTKRIDHNNVVLMKLAHMFNPLKEALKICRFVLDEEMKAALVQCFQ